ncbi:MAG: cyclic nucleotide-binding domain-containing protein [Deltaproteobacteria bacterium]|nr:cyclic nucleotide-binding domain-containing protein [Deltaproteobacteria bacterium]
MSDQGYLKETGDIIQKLRSIPTLNVFREVDLKGILSLSKMVKYDAGEFIIKEGQYDNWMFFLISGKVGIQKQGETLNVLQRRGDIFGEMGIIDGSPRSASIIALNETTCLAADISYMDRLEGNDRIAFTAILYRIFAEILASRLRAADQKWLSEREENAKLKKELQKLKSGH